MPLILLPQNWATGDVIPSGWANNIGANFANVDSRTGGDPGLPDYFLASQVGGLTGVWRYLRTADFRAATIPDAAMINQKVNQVSPQYPSFAAPPASGFFDILGGPNGPADAPIAGNLEWHLIQARYPGALDYRVQIACYNGYDYHTYVRLVINGTPTPWRKLLHTGNLVSADVVAALGFTPFSNAGGTVSGNVTVTGYLNVGNGVSTYNQTGISSDAFLTARTGVSTQAGGFAANAGSITTNDGAIGTGNGSVYTNKGDIVAVLGSVVANLGTVQGLLISSLGNITAPVTGTVTAGEANFTGSTGGITARMAQALRVGGIQVPSGGVTVDGGDVNVNPGTVRVKGFEVYHPGNLPPGGGGSGGETIPSGVIVAYEGTSQPTNWTFVSSTYQGRFLMVAGAGQHNTSGGAQSHGHTVNLQHAHSGAALSISGSTGASSDINGLATAGGVNLNTTGHTHGAGTLDVGGNTDNALGTAQSIPGTDHLPPYRAINHIRRN